MEHLLFFPIYGFVDCTHLDSTLRGIELMLLLGHGMQLGISLAALTDGWNQLKGVRSHLLGEC